MSKQDKENELDTRKIQNSLSAAKDNPETDFYENPIEKPVQSTYAGFVDYKNNAVYKFRTTTNNWSNQLLIIFVKLLQIFLFEFS